MRFYKKRDQAAHIWDSSKGSDDKDGNKKGSVVISFERQTRDDQGIDGFYDTDKKGEIKLLKELGYECADTIPEEPEVVYDKEVDLKEA